MKTICKALLIVSLSIPSFLLAEENPVMRRTPGSSRLAGSEVSVDESTNQTTLYVPRTDVATSGTLVVGIGDGATSIGLTSTITGVPQFNSVLTAGDLFIDKDGILEVSALTVEDAGGVVSSAGVFVNYRASTLQLADSRDYNTYATHFVYEKDGTTLTLVTAVDNVSIQFAAGKGSNANANLYIYEDGKVTDDAADLRNTSGYLNNGRSFCQRVGYRKGTVSGGAGIGSVVIAETEP